VYRAELPDRSIYVKVVPERPKRFPARVPPERVFSEAEALRRFRSLAEGLIEIPEVLFVDGQEMALGMSDVGEGRQVLFSVIADEFDLLVEQADALGAALGRIHRGTRGNGTIRPAMEEAIVRQIIFDGLLGPGAQQVLGPAWANLNAEMQARKECLVHGDLWSKNLLVRAGKPVAVVDFEGVCYGDPAFDLGTLMAVALIPALDRPKQMASAFQFISRLTSAWTLACGSEAWAGEVLPRAFRATACFLASRGFGPFAYAMSDRARECIAALSRSLEAAPPETIDAFHSCVLRHGVSNLTAAAGADESS